MLEKTLSEYSFLMGSGVLMGVTRARMVRQGTAQKGWWRSVGVWEGSKLRHQGNDWTAGMLLSPRVSHAHRATLTAVRSAPGTRRYPIAISGICRFAEELSNVRWRTETTPNGPATL